MGMASARAAIQMRLKNGWAQDPPILFEGDHASPPKGEAWIRCTIRHGEGHQITLGSRPKDRWVGLIIVDVFVPENTGTAMADRYADLITPLFNGKQFDGINCRVVEPHEVGRVAGGWWQLQLRWPFYRDEQRT